MRCGRRTISCCSRHRWNGSRTARFTASSRENSGSAIRSRQMRFPVVALLAVFAISGAQGQIPVPPNPGDWPAYGYDQNGRRYSPLTQINTTNVSRLHRVWSYGLATGPVDANANRLETTSEAVPIVVNGVLYSPTIQHSIVALEPQSGEELWKF